MIGFLRNLLPKTTTVTSDEPEATTSRLSLIKSVTPVDDDIVPTIRPTSAVPTMTTESQNTINLIAPKQEAAAPVNSPYIINPFADFEQKIRDEGPQVIDIPLNMESLTKNLLTDNNEQEGPTNQAIYNGGVMPGEESTWARNEYESYIQTTETADNDGQFPEETEVTEAYIEPPQAEVPKGIVVNLDPADITPEVSDIFSKAISESINRDPDPVTTNDGETYIPTEAEIWKPWINITPETLPDLSTEPDITQEERDAGVKSVQEIVEPAFIEWATQENLDKAAEDAGIDTFTLTFPKTNDILPFTDPAPTTSNPSTTNPVNYGDGTVDFSPNYAAGQTYRRTTEADDEDGGMSYGQFAEGGLKTAGMMDSKTLGYLVLAGAAVAILSVLFSGKTAGDTWVEEKSKKPLEGTPTFEMD